MRILHLSDVHIGVESYGNTDPNTGLSSRLKDFLDTLDYIVDFALSNKVDLVLFAGDAYKSRDPSQTHQREFAKRIAKLSAAGLPVFLLVGNHDLPHIASRATALEIFRTLTVPNVTVGDTLSTHQIETLGGSLQIISLPWIRRSAFLAREETRQLTIEEINHQLQERVTDLLKLQIEALDKSLPAVLTGHITLNTARTSSEQSMLLGYDPVLLLSTVASPNLDYVALGHVHKHQVLSTNPVVAYSGSIERIDFGEENDQKGFCLIDIDPHAQPGSRLIDFKFIPVESRTFLTISVNTELGQDPTLETIKAISRHHVSESIVRVKVSMPEEIESALRENDIREALSQAKYITPIVRDIRRNRRTRLGLNPMDGMSPKEALKLYLEMAQFPAERSSTLIRYAEQLINNDGDEDSELSER